MNVTNFFSNNHYFFIPNASNPRVALVVDSKKLTINSFKLYNPFSAKAKGFKKVVAMAFSNLNLITKTLIPVHSQKKSDFIEYLESKLNRQLYSSIYISTAKDKVVLQLQNNNDIIGYLKYPLTEQGKQNLLKEQKAISILSKLKLVPNIILNDIYNGMPFILLQNLEGTIGQVQQEEYRSILVSLKKNRSYALSNHPRVLDLKKRFNKLALNELDNQLDQIVKLSKNTYHEVYEHGDFAPWNLIKTEKGLIPFDFEYFVEYGLEYLDEIKYHFQIEHLLNGKVGVQLIEAIASKMNIEEFELIFQLFLIKEIVIKKENEESYNFENSLLKIMQNGKV